MSAIPDQAWQELETRLLNSPFRAGFKLRKPDIDYYAARGRDTIIRHAFDFVTARLAPAHPSNDGRQTPMKGHPVFVAQHATGTCCRACLRKWHGIPQFIPLSGGQIDYTVSVITRWLDGRNIIKPPASQPEVFMLYEEQLNLEIL